MIQDEDIQTLIHLGLSLLQARTYLSLAKLGKTADVKTIAKASNVARQDTYRVMSELEKIGLAEKVIAKKNMYTATPIEQGISSLLQNKKKECAEIEQMTRLLLKNFREKGLKDFQEEDQQLKVTSEWMLLKKMHEKMIQTAQTSIDITVPAEIFQKMLLDQRLYLKAAKKRGVRIRVITEKGVEKTTSKKAQVLAENLFAEFKYEENATLFGMHIFDNKEVTLNLNISVKDIVPSLWSSDPNIVKLAETYFEHMLE